MSFVPITTRDISKKDVESYGKYIQDINGLFSMVNESFSFEYSYYQKINATKFEQLAKKTSDPELKRLLSEMVLDGTGGGRYLDSGNESEKRFKKALIAFRRNADGTFDVVYCTATQTRNLDWVKISATAAAITA
ncbi:unnamed protein product, partial [Rotaria socialis]